jgi:hypothetical protein
MRNVTIAAILIGAGLSTAATAAAPMKINLQGVLRESPTGPLYLKFSSAGDLDEDGLADEGYLKLTCAGGELRSVHYHVKSPRDSASGQANGKRTHHPVTFVKEWGPATPQLMKVKPTYNIKQAKGARMTMDSGGWTAISLSDADGLCAAATAAAKVVTKTSSNIQNN